MYENCLMLPNKNEFYLLKYISCADKKNELLETILKLGFIPKSREYNPVYQIIDNFNRADILKENV